MEEQKDTQGTQGTQECYDCRRTLSLEHFSRDRTKESGRAFYCRDCYKRRSKTSRLKNKEHYRQVNKAWNQTHPDKMKQYRRNYRERVLKGVGEMPTRTPYLDRNIAITELRKKGYSIQAVSNIIGLSMGRVSEIARTYNQWANKDE